MEHVDVQSLELHKASNDLDLVSWNFVAILPGTMVQSYLLGLVAATLKGG